MKLAAIKAAWLFAVQVYSAELDLKASILDHFDETSNLCDGAVAESKTLSRSPSDSSPPRFVTVFLERRQDGKIWETGETVVYRGGRCVTVRTRMGFVREYGVYLSSDGVFSYYGNEFDKGAFVAEEEFQRRVSYLNVMTAGPNDLCARAKLETLGKNSTFEHYSVRARLVYFQEKFGRFGRHEKEVFRQTLNPGACREFSYEIRNSEFRGTTSPTLLEKNQGAIFNTENGLLSLFERAQLNPYHKAIRSVQMPTTGGSKKFPSFSSVGSMEMSIDNVQRTCGEIKDEGVCEDLAAQANAFNGTQENVPEVTLDFDFRSKLSYFSQFERVEKSFLVIVLS